MVRKARPVHCSVRREEYSMAYKSLSLEKVAIALSLHKRGREED